MHQRPTAISLSSHVSSPRQVGLHQKHPLLYTYHISGKYQKVSTLRPADHMKQGRGWEAATSDDPWGQRACRPGRDGLRPTGDGLTNARWRAVQSVCRPKINKTPLVRLILGRCSRFCVIYDRTATLRPRKRWNERGKRRGRP